MAQRDVSAQSTLVPHFSEFQSRLIEMRRALETRIAEARSNIADQQRLQSEPGDVGDLSVTDTDQDYFLTLADREHHELAEIRSALERLNRGSYGVCETCEERIALERLRSLPFTKLCIECSTAMEQARNRNRPQALPKL